MSCGEQQAISNDKNPVNQLQMLRVTGLALSPSFEITQKHYVSTANFNVNKIYLQAWAKQSEARILVNGVLLSDPGEFNLAIGNNLFDIQVTSPQGDIENYQLTVTRLSQPFQKKKI